MGKDVLRHVVHDRMNKQFAEAVGVHERTVKVHRTATKLGGRSFAELTTPARHEGVSEEFRQPCP